MNKYHYLSIEKGWWEECFNNNNDSSADFSVEKAQKTIPEKLALIHSEVSEALEDYRNGFLKLNIENGKPVGFPSELADIVIRVYDLAGALEIDLDAVLDLKHEYNKTRAYRHGNKKC